MATTRENLPDFQGKKNVTKITGDNGSVSYLTQSTDFASETNKLGASKLNTFESDKKHVFFLFNDSNAEVGRYYLGQKLQGKSASELCELSSKLCFFLSWNPTTSQWVPCVGLGDGNSLAESAVSFK